MWNLLNCYLSGRHEFGISCEPGAIFLRCLHCGRRSPGWSLDPKPQTPLTVADARSSVPSGSASAVTHTPPFGRAGAATR